jgi:hypothetical protein
MQVGAAVDQMQIEISLPQLPADRVVEVQVQGHLLRLVLRELQILAVVAVVAQTQQLPDLLRMGMVAQAALVSLSSHGRYKQTQQAYSHIARLEYSLSPQVSQASTIW